MNLKQPGIGRMVLLSSGNDNNSRRIQSNVLELSGFCFGQL
ncbi:MAG: hypothetical protein Q7U18_00915 [Methylobacter sp.]|nr:hypothetical protein [Methylobacter sp.]